MADIDIAIVSSRRGGRTALRLVPPHVGAPQIGSASPAIPRHGDVFVTMSELPAITVEAAATSDACHSSRSPDPVTMIRP